MTAEQTPLERVRAVLAHGQEFGNTSVVVNVEDLAAALQQPAPQSVSTVREADGQWTVVADRARGDHFELGDTKAGDRVTYLTLVRRGMHVLRIERLVDKLQAAPAGLTLKSMPIGTQFWMRYRPEHTSTPDHWYHWARVARGIVCLSEPIAGAKLTLREAEQVHDVTTIRGLVAPTPEPSTLERRVRGFINERTRYVEQSRSREFGPDWVPNGEVQGHLDARRQLAQALGWTVPSEPGDRTGHPTRDAVVSTSEV